MDVSHLVVCVCDGSNRVSDVVQDLRLATETNKNNRYELSFPSAGFWREQSAVSAAFATADPLAQLGMTILGQT